MGKKDKTIPQPQQIKSKISKSSKPKNKQMFVELQTHQQNKINKLNHIKANHVMQIQKMDQQNIQDSQISNENIEVNKNNQNLDKVCAAVHHLILKNKINAKNAFEVPFIDLQKLQDFQKISDSQNGWRKISSTLQNDSKIYSYRVDAIHSIAYKIINTMSRNQDTQQTAEPNSTQKQQQLKKQPTLLQQLSIPQLYQQQKQNQISQTLHTMLQKNIQVLNMQAIDKIVQFNPTYERTKRRFDQGCLKGMLVNNLQIDANLQLCVNQTRKIRPSGMYRQMIPKNIQKVQQNIQICKKIDNTKKSIYATIKQQYIPASGYELSWKQIISGTFDCQTQQIQINQNQMDIQGEDKQKQNTQYKKVQDAIKMKNKKRMLKNSTDVVQDGLTWLSDMDKKMLGIAMPTVNNTLPTVKKVQSKTQKNQDDIDFDTSIIVKKDVYSQQTMQKLKNELYQNQQLQQKHLLPIRLFRKFKVEQIMTLRQQPIIQYKTNEIIQNQIQILKQHQRQIQQIDIKSQQLSIRESKQKLKQIMTKQTDYNTLYKKFTNSDHFVSQQLCFLTILHLANQNNLRLEQINQNNFKIKY